MLKQAIILCFFLLCYSPSIYGQLYLNDQEIEEWEIPDTTVFFITRIEVDGNNKTRAQVILRELYFKERQYVTFGQISAALKRVESLALFTRVQFNILKQYHDSHLVITVYERWYIFPLPVLYRNERTWTKVSYGFKLLYYNFLGRNILLNFTTAFGYNPQIKFSYLNPWFLGDLKLFTNFSFYHSRIRSKSPQLADFEDKRYGLEWLIGKGFGRYTFLVVNLGYTMLQAPSEIGLTLSPVGKDYLPSILISFLFDNRDYKQYPHKGRLLNFWAKHVGPNQEIDYYRYGADVRYYFPVTRKITLALRHAIDLASGRIPSYDRVYFGYEERIRGRFEEIHEGENFTFSEIELRFPITKIRYLDVEPLPGLGSYSRNLKFGISAGIFIETGSVWYQNQSFAVDRFKTGFGTGIHFHLPYVEVFRIECGFTPQWDLELMADTEVAF